MDEIKRHLCEILPVQRKGWEALGRIVERLPNEDKECLERHLRHTDSLLEDVLTCEDTTFDSRVAALCAQVKIQEAAWFRLGAPHVNCMCDRCAARLAHLTPGGGKDVGTLVLVSFPSAETLQLF